jgi:hypothetical protein
VELLALLTRVSWLARYLDPFLIDRLGRRDEDLEESIELNLSDRGDVQRRCLIVEGGPEDGRIIPLRRTGMTIGRWDPSRPNHREGRLYIDSTCVDRTVSRRALTWQGGDWVDLGVEARLDRGGFPTVSVTGRIQIHPGDRLWLGSATCVQLLD